MVFIKNLIKLRGVVLFIIFVFPVLCPFYASGGGIKESNPFIKVIKNISHNEVVFFLSQLDERKRNTLLKFSKKFDGSKSPVFEFRQINPAKYYLNVHGFNSNFLINFSEKYHSSWKVYPVKIHGDLIVGGEGLSEQRASIEDDSGYQASSEEIGRFIKRKWIFGHSGKAFGDFVSQMFYKSIQNNNLPKGSVFETFDEATLHEDYHLISNSFSNAWLVDYDYLISQFSPFISNTSKDRHHIGFIIEFSHQKIFLASLMIAGIFILIVTLLVLVITGKMLISKPE